MSEWQSAVDAMLAMKIPLAKAEAAANLRFGRNKPTPEQIAESERRERALEKDEQLEITKRFRLAGFKVYNLSQARASKQTPGLADLWCVYRERGLAFWFETKRQKDGEYSDAQLDFRDECFACGIGYHTGDRRRAAEICVEMLGLLEWEDGRDGPVLVKKRP